MTIDCRYGHTAGAEAYLKQAGLILVVLEQRYDVLQSFFLSRIPHRHNCLFLIGNYTASSWLTVDRIGAFFRLDPDRIGAIPDHAILWRDPLWSRDYSKDMVHTEHMIRMAIQRLQQDSPDRRRNRCLEPFSLGQYSIT